MYSRIDGRDVRVYLDPKSQAFVAKDLLAYEQLLTKAEVLKDAPDAQLQWTSFAATITTEPGWRLVPVTTATGKQQ